MAESSDRLVDVLLSRLRAGESVESVVDDYWTRPAHIPQCDLDALLRRLLALDTELRAWHAWGPKAREYVVYEALMRDLARRPGSASVAWARADTMPPLPANEVTE